MERTRQRLAGVAVAIVAQALLPACGDTGSAAQRRVRNVVLVVLDAARADHVGALGYARDTTPHLDELAREGLLFERAYAGSSNALQSLSTLWTGRLPTRGGATGLSQAAPHPELTTLPRLYLRAGHRTALVSNMPALRARGFTFGFDALEVDSVEGRWSGERVTTKALELVDAAGGEPLFLAVAYGDAGEPHLPAAADRARFDVPQPAEALSLPTLRSSAGALAGDLRTSPGFLDLVARYDAELAYVDSCLGALVAGLAQRGVLDETLLVVTSARGVEFLEHGYVGSGWTVYEEVVHVPLVIRAPGLVAARREGQPVSLADLVPTLARVLDLEAPERELDGAPLLERRTAGLAPLARSGAVICEVVVPEHAILRACIAGDTKLVETVRWVPPSERAVLEAGFDALAVAMLDGETPRPGPFDAAARTELYDLGEDPAEARDLAPTSADPVARLRAWLERYRAACARDGLDGTGTPRPATPPGSEAAEHLRALGYL